MGFTVVASHTDLRQRHVDALESLLTRAETAHLLGTDSDTILEDVRTGIIQKVRESWQLFLIDNIRNEAILSRLKSAQRLIKNDTSTLDSEGRFERYLHLLFVLREFFVMHYPEIIEVNTASGFSGLNTTTLLIDWPDLKITVGEIMKPIIANWFAYYAVDETLFPEEFQLLKSLAESISQGKDASEAITLSEQKPELSSRLLQLMDNSLFGPEYAALVQGVMGGDIALNFVAIIKQLLSIAEASLSDSWGQLSTNLESKPISFELRRQQLLVTLQFLTKYSRQITNEALEMCQDGGELNTLYRSLFAGRESVLYPISDVFDAIHVRLLGTRSIRPEFRAEDNRTLVIRYLESLINSRGVES